MPGGRAIGAMLFVTVFLAASYYTVVVAQVLFYALRGGIVAEPEAWYGANFGGVTPLNLGATVLVFVAMGAVAAAGVRRGVERALADRHAARGDRAGGGGGALADASGSGGKESATCSRRGSTW